MTIKDTLIKKLKDKEAHIAVLGLGYVGLPLAVVFGEAGYNVTGIDPDARKVDLLNKGISYIPDVKTEIVAALVESGNLTATTDFSMLKEMDAVSICVPTPLRQTGDPDMSYILSATEELAKYVHKDMVIVLESTTYPGTTREFMLPMLIEKSGLKVGEDFFVAFSPERVESSWRNHGDLLRSGRSLVLGRDPDCVPGHFGRSSRNGETAREYLPHDQHRYGQRVGYHV